MIFPREAIRRFLARNRRNRFVGKIGRNLGYYWQGFENQDYDVRTNGEQFVLAQLVQLNARPLVFDVGAHWGEWAGMAASTAPAGTIHSFEVIPSTFAKLRQNCADLPNVTVHNLGLGETAGDLEFSVAKDRDELSSGVAGVHGKLHHIEYSAVRCPVETGDSFCAQRGFTRVDFLKIDVEGMEPYVLKGFATMLAEGRIRAVQFEYGQINLQARFFLGDFYELLGRYGMLLGKIYPDHVDFRSYDFTQDTLSGPNFLAVRKDDKALTSRLKN